jgi:formylglycine-generating enzyme required for sulfatase activity
MTGSGTQWSLQRKLEQEGAVNVSLVALNADDIAGRMQAVAVTTYKRRYAFNRADGTVTDLLNKTKLPRFKNNGDDTYTDLMTGLVWVQQPKQIAVNYEDAVAYCNDLKISGKTGWRLPTLREWKQLVDRKQQNPALPVGNPFENVSTQFGYWSKSRHKFGPQYVYQMSLWYGKPNHLKKDANAIVWPVRYEVEQE